MVRAKTYGYEAIERQRNYEAGSLRSELDKIQPLLRAYALRAGDGPITLKNDYP